MDLKKLQTFESLKPIGVGGLPGANPSKTNPAEELGPSFDDTLQDSLGGITAGLDIGATSGIGKIGTTGLTKQLGDGVKFSNHAVERMRSRGIYYSPADVQKLNEAVAKADAKGSKNSLILLNDSALIVSVKNNTVVTVMDKANMKENVFTNIDSTVVL